MLGQAHLAQVLFPVGEYTKPQVRELARTYGLPVAAKHDSQDLCFLKDGDYRGFLRRHGDTAPQSGPIVDATGRQLGQHAGLGDYTIGQRRVGSPRRAAVRRRQGRDAQCPGRRPARAWLYDG
jgi:tRNA-specific 2-thiouridylase